MGPNRGVYTGMFEQSIVTYERSSSKPWSFALSLTLQAAGITTLILLPLIYTDHLSQALIRSGLTLPTVPLPKGPAPEIAQPASVSRPQPRAAASNTLLAFIRNHAPRPLSEILMDPAPVTGIPTTGGTTPNIAGDGGLADGILSGLGNNATRVPPPPPPPPVERKAPEQPPQVLRVSSGVLAAKMVRRVVPVYPPLAKQARVSGTVRLMGKIGRDGSIQELQVLGGHPLLVKAAVDAVRQWLYQPTLLNGEPVEVMAPIEVNFTLAQ
ncbi:hypothetical protein F183_A18430 [Bryobacterales bacterium F-183]|nr:hypothetical protein F183_A18430 [Bryobacterales bacterium F-183]